MVMVTLPILAEARSEELVLANGSAVDSWLEVEFVDSTAVVELALKVSEFVEEWLGEEVID